MNGIIFALLIIGLFYMRGQTVKFEDIAEKAKKDQLTEEDALRVFGRIVWFFILMIGWYFYNPFVWKMSLDYLFDLQYEYWWLFAVHMFYVFSIKPMKK